MFRPMRRKKQELEAAQCQEILAKGTYGILAVQGDDDYPYTVPLNYVCQDGRIFFHCAKEGHKMDAIRHHDKVSFCVVDRDDVVAAELTTYFRSVVVFGRVRIIEDQDAIMAAARCLGMRFLPDLARVMASIEKELRALCMFELKIEHVSGKEAIELVQQRDLGRARPDRFDWVHSTSVGRKIWERDPLNKNGRS